MGTEPGQDEAAELHINPYLALGRRELLWHLHDLAEAADAIYYQRELLLLAAKAHRVPNFDIAEAMGFQGRYADRTAWAAIDRAGKHSGQDKPGQYSDQEWAASIEAWKKLDGHHPMPPPGWRRPGFTPSPSD
jgi:hypothetical protein